MITFINALSENWADYFMYALVQNTFFLAIILFLLHILRKAPAGIRSGVALLGMIKLLIPPFLPFTVRSAAISTESSAAVHVGNIGVSAVPETSAPFISLTGVLFTIWVATAFMMLFYFLYSTFRLKWHLRTAIFIKRTDVDGMKIDVYCASDIPAPMSIGLFSRRVYVPPLWRTLSNELRHSLLLHEVAHLRRQDGFSHVLQVLVQALYFFHPLVWILSRKADEYREMACDDMAVERSPVSPLAYSRCLLHVAENMLSSRNYSYASAFVKQKHRLYHRVHYQIKENKMKNISKRHSCLICTLLLVLIVPLSWYCKGESGNDNVPAGNNGTIYGKVVDAETGEALAGANIILRGSSQGAATDAGGEFLIRDVLPGEYPLECSLIGYRPSRSMVKVGKGRSVENNFKLKLSRLQGEKITVTAKRDPDPGTRTEFVPYDEPPKPVGGASAVLEHLKYPEEARERGIEGMVLLNAYINRDGEVEEVEILRSQVPEECNAAAVEALKKSRWTPAKQRGNPVAVWVSVPVEFKLEDENKEPEFIPYDEAPKPSGGGAGAIAKNVVYPESYIDKGITGVVLVQMQIGKDGKTQDAVVKRSLGIEAFDNAALDAVRKTEWIPAKQKGQPVAVWITVPVQFKP
ncbi:MAG: M56 family metallopeptidase [Fidelibacterota bacterium]